MPPDCTPALHKDSAIVRNRTGGFTLIELMIVVLVIAVLAAIAYPNYREYTIRTRRAAAAACLLEGAQILERRYTTTFTYAGAAPTCSQAAELGSSYAVPVLNVPNSRQYSLTIAPRGAQVSSDTKCGTLSIDQAGAKGETGTGSVADCW